ncbi:hypothetical protein [Hymenobacter sp.]|uniref:hypothetical protein n=1 Tax=Hymenobacter sp. TaxID=1898978 RepID=UPI00286D0412|nr:hypothetical protein [Hymenobacter sp.]
MPSFITRWALAATLLLAGLTLTPPARAQAKTGYQFLQMTTIESIVPGGLGRSRVLFTPEWKGTKESNMENLFSLLGINISNVRVNEELVIRYLGEITADGWELYQTVPLTQTIQGAGGQSQQGIFLTRYLFRKAR